jgi:hypothetical protein
VKHLIKVVAFMLAAVLIGTPLAAFAKCDQGAAMAGCCTGQRCPMMMHMPTAQVSQMPAQDGSCCQVSPLPTRATKPAVARQEKTSVQLLTPQTVIAVVPPRSSTAEAPPLPDVPSNSPQAVLCTFLV